jgi:hypothetical protein
VTAARSAHEILGYDAHDTLLQGGGCLDAVDLRDPLDMLDDGDP